LVPGNDCNPDTIPRGCHTRFFEALLHDQNAGTILREQLAKCKAVMDADGLDTLVLSGENLCNFGQQASLRRANLQRATELFDCRIVLYARRQDDFYASAWKQWGLKRFENTQDFIDNLIIGHFGDWSGCLEPWEKLFGVRRITVRRYQRSALRNGDIVNDFCARLGLIQEGCKTLPWTANPSVGDPLARIANRVQDLFTSQHDNEFYKVMGSLIGEAAYRGQSPSAFLTTGQRRAIREHYRDSNERLRRKYFAELSEDEPLFDTSYPDDDKSDSMEQLRREHDLIVRAVYALARKLAKNERLE
jgi:hypothetical protein